MSHAADQHHMFHERRCIVLGIPEYLISVSAAAIVSSCIKSFFSGKDAVSTLIQTICGIFVSLVAIQPVAQLEFTAFQMPISAFSDSAEHIVASAQEDAALKQQSVIKEKTEAYIFDKAKAMGCRITVSVELSQDPPFLPQAVSLTGDLSPHARNQLTTMIATDLGIQPEAQRWSN